MSNSNLGGNHSPPPPYTASATIVDETKVAPGVYPPSPQFPTTVYPPTTNSSGNNAVAAQPPSQSSIPVISARTATFGPFPVEMDCPYCQNHIVTHTSKVPGLLPWVICIVCAVLGFVLVIPWCLCCLPFCIDACLDVLHSCPSCKRLVGKFSRL